MFLTIFTPTYNRVKTLGRTYQSLRKQTCKDFIWLIVDDGSEDDTGQVVKSWIEKKDNGFEIRYIYKENGGLHTAYNTAIASMESELAVCVDSDDYMPANAVQLIKDKWEHDGSELYAGIVGLDYSIEGELIGGELPNCKSVNLIDILTGKCGVKPGDKKNCVRVDLYKAVAPMKVYPGEKNFNPHFMHLEISRKYDFLVLNEELCTVDYQPNGMTANIFKQYYNSPNSFLDIRKQYLTFQDFRIRDKIRHEIHMVSSALLSKRFFRELRMTDHKSLMILCTPLGILLTIIVIIKGR